MPEKLKKAPKKIAGMSEATSKEFFKLLNILSKENGQEKETTPTPHELNAKESSASIEKHRKGKPKLK